AAPVTPKPAATAKPAPAPVAPKPAQPTPAPTAPAASFAEQPGTAKTTPEQSDRLRQAVRDRISELNAPPPATKPAAEIRAEQRAAAGEQQRQAEAEKARVKAEADEAKARDRAAAEEAKARASREAAEAKAAAKTPQFTTTKFEPLSGPPTGIPASKEARLADLLKKYKADEITPEQYHTERAKILAEP